MPLSERKIQTVKPAEKAYKVFDERGLFLLVKPSGAKYWRMKYRFGGKEKLLAFGVYDDVTLADARNKRDRARNLLANGVDPGQMMLQQKEKLNNNHRTCDKAARIHSVLPQTVVQCYPTHQILAKLFSNNSNHATHSENEDNKNSSSLFSWLLPPYSSTGFFSKESKEIMFGAACSIVSLPFSIAVSLLEKALRSVLNQPWGKAPPALNESDIFTLAIVCVIGPVIEELLFRGLLKTGIRSVLEKTGLVSPSVASTSALVSSSLLFSAAHDYGSKSSRFIFAMETGLLMDNTDAGILTAITSHMVHNTLIAGLKAASKAS